MSKLVLSVLVSCFLLLQSVSCRQSFEDRAESNNDNGDTSYDHLVLAQSWPQTSCWSLNKKWHNAETSSCSPCKMPKEPNSWTLHGLWPSNSDGPHIGYCSDSVKFNSNLISPALKAELTEKWPTYKLSFGNDGFWGYEYKKHGTCALDNPSTNEVTKYFSKAIELLNNYNVGKVLESQEILPGRAYDFDEIHSAVASGIGVEPYMQCTRNPETKEQYIMQINVCFDKSFQLIDCPHRGDNISNCKRKDKIVYPENLQSCQ